MIVQTKQYMLKCWRCKNNIIYTHSDCGYNETLNIYRLICPNCREKYYSNIYPLFVNEYKAKNNPPPNNWNELKDFIETENLLCEIENQDIICEKLNKILKKMKDLESEVN